MLGDEALGSEKPQSDIKLHKQATPREKGYLIVISILFTILIALCINYAMTYRSYWDFKNKYTDAFRRVNEISADRQSLGSEIEAVKKENGDLIDKYNSIAVQNQEIQRQLDEIKKQNAELLKRNKELVDDNIALQNSVKAAAAVGIKPQNYTRFDGLLSRGSIERGKYIGKFLGTAYTPSKDECGNNKGITNSGKPIIPGISIAIDNNYWPFGTVFYIKGLGYAVAMDTGSKIKGKNRFDFAVFDKDFANALGSRNWQVYLVKLGNGKVDKVRF